MGVKNVKVEFKFNKKNFIEMIKMMAIPSNGKNDSFISPMIYPMFIPANKEKQNNAMFEWIIKAEVIIWVRASYELNIGLKDPFRIPINVEKTLKALSLKAFKDRDEVFFIHDDDKGIQIITDGSRNTQNIAEGIREKSTRFDMFLSSEEPVKNVFQGFPGKLEPETEVIQFYDGKTKPSISGSCDKDFLAELFDDTKKIISEKEKRSGIVYHFIIDEDSHSIKVSTEGIDGFFNKIYFVNDVIGHGELHYKSLFEDVIGVLSSDPFKFYAIDKGPMWIMQDTAKTKVRYLIPIPAISTIENES
jgi:hypothetical protein